MKNALAKAHSDAFDAHEDHRKALADARLAHRKARDADERVRQLRRLERERAASSNRTKRGRAA